jgi:predicted HNH restriction endonuclease
MVNGAKVCRSTCSVVFGKEKSELTAEEMKVYRQATQAASYYRRYEQNKKYQRDGAQRRKLALLALLGWAARCMVCGYDRYIGALDFHHLDPSAKDGRVTTIEEARKCRMLCANCHREAHRDGGDGRPPKALHPLVQKYLDILGIVRPGIQESRIANVLDNSAAKAVDLGHEIDIDD